MSKSVSKSKARVLDMCRGMEVTADDVAHELGVLRQTAVTYISALRASGKVQRIRCGVFTAAAGPDPAKSQTIKLELTHGLARLILPSKVSKRDAQRLCLIILAHEAEG